jgi:hypothetical protein
MTNVNRCVPDAGVVGAQPLPAAPTEFDWPDRKPAVGCNHLVCLWCKAKVKSRVGFLLQLDWDNRDVVPKRAAQLHSTDDWAAVAGVQLHPDCRLYACRCFYHSEFSLSHTFNPERVDKTGEPSRNLPWTCAGHPPLELPVELDGRTIADASDFADAVTAAANNSGKADVVRGLYYRTHHGPLEAVVPEVLARIAEGATPLAPPVKRLFEAQTNLAPLNSFVEELVRYQTGLSPANLERRNQVVDILSAVIWQRPSGLVETGTLELLRTEALQGIVTSEQLRMFEAFDREWLVAHVEQLVSKRPDRAGGILARAGRAMLFNSLDPEGAMRTLSALARKIGASVEILSAQAEAELGVMILDSGNVLDALKQQDQ